MKNLKTAACLFFAFTLTTCVLGVVLEIIKFVPIGSFVSSANLVLKVSIYSGGSLGFIVLGFVMIERIHDFFINVGLNGNGYTVEEIVDEIMEPRREKNERKKREERRRSGQGRVLNFNKEDRAA